MGHTALSDPYPAKNQTHVNPNSDWFDPLFYRQTSLARFYIWHQIQPLEDPNQDASLYPSENQIHPHENL